MMVRRKLLDSVAVGVVAVVITFLAVGAPAATATAAVPRPDHVVVVVLENHSAQQVIGATTAPYINSLAASGALMTQSYAVAHPSQPNYLALFSGSTQGVSDDSCPLTISGPNFGSALIAAGNSFIGYSEDLPSVGYTGCTNGNYARKHNPWVNFSDVPAASNQSLTAFPTDYNQLPTVSYVIPNLQNDMHDGTIAQADSWLQSTLGGYVTWARTHNSLLLLTFDEDDYHAANQIPTIFVGAGVVSGVYPELVTHYNILRTLEDAYGLAPLGGSATAAPITDIWGIAGPVAPVARFTSAVSGLSISVDGSGSSAADGSVASYAWTFGDGMTATGVTTSHSYTAASTYQVSLTVTDAAATTGTTTREVTVTTPSTTLASDSFSRTVAAGFGTADIGGAWSAPTTSAYSVAGTKGIIRIAAGGGAAAYLPTVSSVDTDFQVVTLTDKPATGSGLYLSYVGRRVAGIGDYRVKVRLGAAGDVTLVPERVNSVGVETTLGPQSTVPGWKYLVGDQLQTRLQVTGTNPTTIRAKVWKVGGTEPVAWAVTGTDSTAGLQASGSIGISDYLSSTATNAPIAISYDNLVATSSTTVVSSPPTAAFTASVTNLSVAVDGSGSTDPAGSIVGWSWSFGDGSTGAGSSANHAYAVAATYTVSLTVTNNLGATGTTTRSVSVVAPVNRAPVASFTTTVSNLSVAVDGSASSDSDGSVVSWFWAFGDGATATGPMASYTYAAAGTYTVSLTVTDNSGATTTTTGAVTVVSPVTGLASDSFTRALASGWGTADLGGLWTLGSAAAYSVNGATGMVGLAAGTGASALLNSVSSSGTDLQVTVATDKPATGSGLYVSVLGRRVAGVGDYRVKMRLTLGGGVSLVLERVTTAGAETMLGSQTSLVGLSYTVGDQVRVRLQVTGVNSTTLRAKAWKATAVEPASWLVSATDSTAVLQVKGGIGLVTYLSSTATSVPIAVSFDDLVAAPTP